jgi:3-hexulose-6-phosphate synthase
MAKPLIQLALDSLDYDTTVKLAQQAARYVDILEIGTPCVKVNGLALVKDLRARFPNKLIFADLKTMDAGFYEAEPFFKAGADITTVLGTADLDTIKGVIAVANKYGKQAQVDLINVHDKSACAKAAAAAGAHIIGVHTGIDQQLAGQTPFTDLANLLALGLDVKVSVAGGIKQTTVQQVVASGANIIVVGGAITGAANAATAASEIRDLVDAAAGA